MARRRGTALIRAEIEGAGPVARSFSTAERQLQDLLIRELRTLAVRGIATLAEHAPEDTGDLIRRLRAVPSYRAARPRVDFISPTEHDDYPYTAVTRFGHRQVRIEGRPWLTIHAFGEPRTPASVTELRRSVYGFGHSPFTGRRPHDWVRDAEQEIDREMDAAAARLGRTATTQLLPGHRAR